MGRAGLVTAFLAAFGGAIAEVGAIIMVGGNIRGVTRTMTTAIALETSRGDLSLALGLGMVLAGADIGRERACLRAQSGRARVALELFPFRSIGSGLSLWRISNGEPGPLHLKML